MYRLDALKDGGITLFSAPVFEKWVVRTGDETGRPQGLAVDECRQVYFIASGQQSGICALYRYDLNTRNQEKLTVLPGKSSEDGEPGCPLKIIPDKQTLWMNDAAFNRVIGVSLENYQIRYVIKNYEYDDQAEPLSPVDIALNENGDIYVLNRNSALYRILKYAPDASLIACFIVDLKEPRGLAVGKNNRIYVLDGKNLLRFDEKASALSPGFKVDLTQRSGDPEPSSIVINRKGIISIAFKDLICQYDHDGSFTDKIRVPDFKGRIQGLASDHGSNLYVSADNGIAFFSSEHAFTREGGVYYSRTLDSGINGCQWHRIALNPEISPKTVMEIYYHSSDDQELKKRIDSVLSDMNRSAREKAEEMDKEIGTWSLPEKNPGDMLFRERAGRYLWLKLVLSTFDQKEAPQVREMKVYYPRISYLRYLPAVYQEDPGSKDFLERFLSIFETMFYGLELKTDNIFKLFDPDAVPGSFLHYLAGWLNMSLEEGWPEEIKRVFIREAFFLYKRKGAPEGLRRLIEIYTGKTPLLIEHALTGKPMVLGKQVLLGVHTVLNATPVRGFSLGDDSILGSVALRDTVQSIEDPFLPLSHRFTVIIDLDPEESIKYEAGLGRILNEWKPAHTSYTLRVLKQMRLGADSYVGINRLDDNRQIALGVNSTIGSAIVLVGGEQGGKVEQHSRLQRDTKLL